MKKLYAAHGLLAGEEPVRTRTVNPYDALRAAREKLKLYRGCHTGEFVGGMEFTALMDLIERALAEAPPTLTGTD